MRRLPARPGIASTQSGSGAVSPPYLSEIRNEEQLITLVKVRYSLSYETARTNVQGWMAGKQF
jgi:hypothetical protein